MTTQAHIQGDIMMQGVSVVLYAESPNGTTVWAPGAQIRQYVQPGVEPENVEPMRLRDDEARALLTALIRYYDGGEDTRSLRRDYDAERKRVDLFISHLTRTS